MRPTIKDNDRDEIIFTLNGKEIRRWSYADRRELRLKMRLAHEFIEGWSQCDKHGRADALAARLEEAGQIIRGFLQCAEIADCGPDYKEPDTVDLESAARAFLAETKQ